MKEEYEDIIFTGVDIPKETRKIIDTKEDEICEGMTNDERLIYKFGLDTFQTILQAICDGEEPVVHIRNQQMEEFDLKDLLNKILCS